MTKEAILQFESVTKIVRSGSHELLILDDVSFTLKKGETCAIVGPSGSGKTTLLTLAAGLDKPSKGRVLFENRDLATFDEDQLCSLRGRSIGFIFQSYQLIPSLRVLENVMLPLEIRGISDEDEAKQLLETVGLKDRMHHYPGQLSGGEQQRVAIVRAFINKPELLFADEPTGSLDRESAETAITAMFELNKSRHCAIALVTHDHDLAARLERKIVLKNGKVISDA